MVVQTELNDDMVLDCYRLASYYQVNPEIFLNMPINDVRLHMRRTAELERSRQRERNDG